MYSTSFVVAVMKDGKPLRETRSGLVTSVHMPFYSEYSLRLKSKNDRKAVASIEIDGTDVLGGHKIILPAHGVLDLERFMVDGDLANGKKFKFVPLSDSRVQDPTESQNGLVKVTFTLERTAPTGYVLTYPAQMHYNTEHTTTGTPPMNTSYSNNTRTKSKPMRFFGASNSGSGARGVTFEAAPEVACACAMGFDSDVSFGFTQDMYSPDTGLAGATIEGASSRQQFSYGDIGPLESVSTTVSLRLVGTKSPAVLAEDTRRVYCGQCGKQAKASANYCSRCGSRL
jgi:ribosomal protein S27AE